MKDGILLGVLIGAFLFLCYLVYCIIKMRCFRVRKLYVVFLELCIIATLLKELYYFNSDGVVFVIISQIIFIAFLKKDYARDSKKQKLYEIINRSKIIVLAIVGFNDIEKDRISYVENFFTESISDRRKVFKCI